MKARGLNIMSARHCGDAVNVSFLMPQTCQDLLGAKIQLCLVWEGYYISLIVDDDSNY